MRYNLVLNVQKRYKYAINIKITCANIATPLFITFAILTLITFFFHFINIKMYFILINYTYGSTCLVLRRISGAKSVTILRQPKET